MRIIATAMLIVTLLAACEPAPQATDNVAVLPTDEAITASATATFAPPTASPTWVSFLQTPTPGLPSSTDEAPPPPTPPTSTTIATPPPQPPSTGGQCPVIPPPGWVLSTIQFGQTIGRLAQCVGSTVNELVAVNCLPNGGNLIYPGDPIYMPGICAPTATPDTPPEFKTTTSTSTPLPPPPSKNNMTIRPTQVTPGNWVWLVFENFGQNTYLPVKIGSISVNVCIDNNGFGIHPHWVPANSREETVQVRAYYDLDRDTGVMTVVPCVPGQPNGKGTQGAHGNFKVILPTPTSSIPSSPPEQDVSETPSPSTPASSPMETATLIATDAAGTAEVVTPEAEPTATSVMPEQYPQP